MNKIKIKNQQSRIKVNLKALTRTADHALKHQGVRGAELSVILVDDKTIQKLNKLYLGKDAPTDVLAFRMAEGKFGSLHPEILGDVIISAQTAGSFARALKIRTQKELSLYLIHGILHLLGFEDKTRRGFARMKKIQEEILADA